MSKEFLAKKKEIDELKINKANASDVYTKQEVNNKITEKVSEIVAEAPEDFDTLKEMSDWINNHEDSAAAMNTAINNKLDKTTTYAASDRTGGAATYVKAYAADNFNKERSIPFTNYTVGTNSGDIQLVTNEQFTYNPATETLKVKNLEAENINQALNNKLDNDTTYAASDRTGGAASRLKINPNVTGNADNPIFFKGTYNPDYPNEVDTFVDSDFTYRNSTKTLKVKNLDAENITESLNNKLDKNTSYAVSDRTSGAASRVKINSSSSSNVDNPVFFKGSYNSEYPNEVDTYVDSDFTYKKSTKTLKVKNIESDSINALQTAVETNAKNISTHETKLTSIGNTISNKLDKTTTYAVSDRTGGAASRVKINSSGTGNADNPIFFRGTFSQEHPNEVDTFVDSDFTYKNSTKTLKVKNIESDSINALQTSIETNAQNISAHETRLNSIDNTLSGHDTRIIAAQQKADSVDEKADATNTVVGKLNNSLQSAFNSINNKLDKNTSYAASNRTGGAATRLKVNPDSGSNVDNPVFFKGSYNSEHPNEVDTYVDSDFTYKKSTKTLKVKNLDAENITESLNNIGSSVNKNKSDIAVNRTTLGTQCKNLFDWKNATYSTSLRLTQTKTESGISVTSTDSWAVTAYKLPTLEVGTAYIFSTTISDLSVAGGKVYIMISTSTSGSNIVKAAEITSNGTATIKFEATSNTMYVLFLPNYSNTVYTNSFTASNIMLRYADIIDATYEPYTESVDERLIKNKSDIAVNKTTLGYQCKNMLELSHPLGYKYTNAAGTATWTFNNDYSVSMVANSQISSGVAIPISEVTLKKGSYIYSVEGYSTPNITHTQLYSLNADGSWTWLANLSAIENKITVTEETTYSFRAYRNNLVTVGVTETLYPMLRSADITDSTFEPYSDNVDTRLIKNKSDIAVIKSTLGYQCKNLLKIVPRTITSGGVTCVIDDDGIVTVNGTASETVFINIRSNIYLDETLEYTLTGTYDNSSYGYIYYQLGETTGGNNRYNDFGNGVTFKGAYGSVSLRIPVGAVLNNVKYYPMLRYADITDDTYEPYKPSLQEQIDNFGTQQSQIALWSPSSGIVNNVNVSCTGLFTKYSSVICIVGYSEGLRSLTLPLKYIKSLGTSNAYYPEKNLKIKYVDDDHINIKDTASSDAVIGRVDIINLY